jgi:DNA-binding transcriptional LysR family regulator
MRLRQLEYFIAVAEIGSVTQAAADLFVAQPSLSQQLTSLEREVGAALFERLPRGVRLSPAGRAFLIEAKSAVEAVARAQEAARAVLEGRQGELSLATITSLAVGVVPSLAVSWNHAHPRISLRLAEHGHPDRLEDSVRLGEADLGLGPVPHGAMAEVHELGAEEFVFVLQSDDPVAAQPSVDPTQLADRPWVLFTESHGLHRLVRRMCSVWGFVPTAAVRTTQTEAAVRLAAAGLGPAVVPANVVNPWTPGVVVRPLSRPVLRKLALYSRAPMGPLAQAFVDLAKANPIIEGWSHAPSEDEGAIYLG